MAPQRLRMSHLRPGVHASSQGLRGNGAECLQRRGAKEGPRIASHATRWIALSVQTLATVQIMAEETARAILLALVQGMQLRGGQGAQIESLSHRLRADGVDLLDVSAGLRHAVEQGWLLYDERNAWIRLTDVGAAAVHHKARSVTGLPSGSAVAARQAS
jgi:hypothetical protein